MPEPLSLLPVMSMSDLPDQCPPRIVIELLSSADVKRLEARDDAILDEVDKLEKRIEGLHRQLYEVMEALANLRNKRN